MSERSFYYNREGHRIGPLPSSGDWPKRYELRGITLDPPENPPEADEPPAVVDTASDSTGEPRRGRRSASQ